MTIKKIVEDYLRKHGYDGLCCNDCGCKLDDLMPCGNPGMACRPGRIRFGSFAENDKGWVIEDAQPARMTSAVLPCNCLTGCDPDCQAHHPQPARTCGDEKPKGAA